MDLDSRKIDVDEEVGELVLLTMRLLKELRSAKRTLEALEIELEAFESPSSWLLRRVRRALSSEVMAALDEAEEDV